MKNIKAGATTRLYYFKKATFMAFTTKVITDTSPDFSDNPQVITESGQPTSVEVDNLTPNTAHWTKAEIWQDGVLNDTSGVETFNTLQAGVITLEYIQTVRSGYGYDVTYRYTSTYAPSSAVLATNGTQFQGFIDSAQNTVSFWVTGLTAGTAYLTNVTMYDIYAESVTVTGSIVTTVVNEITITDTVASALTVECTLDYILDGGFFEGYLEYWLGTQDPSTDQAQGHFYFNNGDTSVIADGLSEDTEYKFRATVILEDETTEIYSNVVVERTTEIDYLKMPFTVENTDSETGVFTFKHWTDLYTYYTYSIDGGTTWNNVTIGMSDITVNVPSGGKIQILGNNTERGMVLSTDNHAAFVFSKKFTVYGNIVSLFDKENYKTLTVANPSYVGIGNDTFFGLFKDNTNLESAENLNFGKLTRPTYHCTFVNMFFGCSNLKIAPKTIGINSIGGVNAAFSGMFWGCSKLVTVPFFENGLRLLSENSTFKGMFRGCSALRNGLDMRNFTWDSLPSGTYPACANMYYDCSSLTLAYTPNVSDSYVEQEFVGQQIANQFTGWMTNVPQNGTLYKWSFLNLPTNSADGIPSGWTVVNY